MNEIKGNEVINGTWGEAWLDGDYLAEITGLEAKIDIDYEDINIPRKLGTAKKMTGWSGTGSLKFNKVTSRFIKLIATSLKEGKQISVTIISKLDDPDALGAERVALQNVTFDDLTLANWEMKTAGAEETAFGYDDFELLDLI